LTTAHRQDNFDNLSAASKVDAFFFKPTPASERWSGLIPLLSMLAGLSVVGRILSWPV
jgi:hypothetical protein